MNASHPNRAFSSSGAYPNLFSPIRLGGRMVRNRLFHISINNHFSDGPETWDKQVTYLGNRAKGGCGAIVSEPVAFAPHLPKTRLRVFDDSMADYGKRWAEAVEPHDCRLLAQLQDPGRGRHRPGRNHGAVGPSYDPDDISLTMPHALTPGEIRRLVDLAGQSTRRLVDWGFSGVEVSAGHGHLFHQFMSPHSNTRDDDYGGPLENRIRLLVEYCQALRAELGSSHILGVKLPGDDGIAGGIDPDMAARIAQALTAAVKVDYIAYAYGAHHITLDLHIPNDSFPRVPFAATTQKLAAATPDVPVMLLGRVTDPAEAEGALEQGPVQLIGLGRALIADPAWPRKACAGRARDIRYCLNHNTCWEIAVERHVLMCDNNPRIGMADELDYRPEAVMAATPRKVVVVGAGVAGLEAAWVAASRGHSVVVFGAGDEAGGNARRNAVLPGQESLSSVYDNQLLEAARYGVDLRLGKRADAAMVLAENPDAVVLATGGRMVWPRVLPDELKDTGMVPDLREALAGLRPGRRQPGTAVIFDMDHTEGTYAAAEHLQECFDKVVILTPRERIAEDCPMTTRQTLLRRFRRSGLDYRCLVEPRWSDRFIDEGVLEYGDVYGGPGGEIADVVFFAYSSPRRPNDDLDAAIRAAGVELHRIGDCKLARAMAYATAEGREVGAKL